LSDIIYWDPQIYLQHRYQHFSSGEACGWLFDVLSMSIPVSTILMKTYSLDPVKIISCENPDIPPA
jgi:hypothetical protein